MSILAQQHEVRKVVGEYHITHLLAMVDLPERIRIKGKAWDNTYTPSGAENILAVVAARAARHDQVIILRFADQKGLQNLYAACREMCGIQAVWNS